MRWLGLVAVSTLALTSVSASAMPNVSVGGASHVVMKDSGIGDSVVWNVNNNALNGYASLGDGAATGDAELIVLPAFTGGPEQLWRMDQLADGTWRIMPKQVPNSREAFVLSATGSSFATLAKFDPKSERHRWLFKTP